MATPSASKQTITFTLTPIKVHQQQNDIEFSGPNDPEIIHRNHVVFQENTTKTENEQLLFNEWRKAENEKTP